MTTGVCCLGGLATIVRPFMNAAALILSGTKYQQIQDPLFPQAHVFNTFASEYYETRIICI